MTEQVVIPDSVVVRDKAKSAVEYIQNHIQGEVKVEEIERIPEKLLTIVRYRLV